MSFTRFHDDPCRIEKQLQESTGPGRYMLDVPGNGLNPVFMEDPYIRLQKWGANLQTNTINLESELLGLTNRLGRDYVNQKPTMNVKSKLIKYPSMTPLTDQTRATHPAWMVREIVQDNFQYLPLDPQENICLPFQNNLNTRNLERDNFKPLVPTCMENNNEQLNMSPYSGTSSVQTLCTKNGTCRNF